MASVVELELRPIDADKSDAVIASALGFAGFLQTRFGPEHLGFYMWRSARVGYFNARCGDEVDPSGLLPDDADITVVFNEVAPRDGSATEAMQLTWDTLIASKAPASTRAVTAPGGGRPSPLAVGGGSPSPARRSARGPPPATRPARARGC